MITTGEGNLFKYELFQGTHDLLTDDIKMAIYLPSVDMGPDTDVYTTTGEIVHTNYPTGGKSVANKQLSLESTGDGTSAETLIFTFDEVEFLLVTSQFSTVMLYNASKSNRTIAIVYLGRILAPDLGGFTIDPEAATPQTGFLTGV